MIDIQIDPEPVDLAPLSEPLTEEQRLEMQRPAPDESLLTQTNIQEMKHQSLKGIAQNQRG
jgi:hypothetical protein